MSTSTHAVTDAELTDIDRTSTFRGLDMSEAVRPLIAELRICRAALRSAIDGLKDIGEAEGPDRRGRMPNKLWHEERARQALAQVRAALGGSNG